MISIENINKYFNRFKKNQVHVINNTSLKLEDNGLVALLGPSGCGKTTLLNVIGGLDKVGSGKIFVDGKKLTSRCSYKTDKLRNLNIGYIFQDYKLVDDMSVYDNVALVLKMIGLKDKNEIKKRVEYVLDKVGMLRYKKRPAGMLSGGERQRVGIARAIVKNPNIILADEPTGNLDSKNSLEVMKIIKSISKDRLVILVTHEQSLAKFYASRIIEIQDGEVIKDYENTSVDVLDYEVDNTFYLKDFKKHNEFSENKAKINVYSNEKINLNIDIVLKNGNIYIQSNTDTKIEVVDENSSIDFVNDSYKKISKDDIDKYEFDFVNIINDNFKKKYSSLFNPVSLIINGFKKVFDFPVIKKILLGGFAISAAFIMFSTSKIAKTFDVDDSKFVQYDKGYLHIAAEKLNVDTYNELSKLEGVEYIMPTKSKINMKFILDDYYQSLDSEISFNASLSDYGHLTIEELKYGRMPENEYEVVIDELALRDSLEEGGLASLNVRKSKKVVGRKIQIGDIPTYFTVVGISHTDSPCIFANKDMFNLFLAYTDNNHDYWNKDNLINRYIVDYSTISNRISLKEGRVPQNDYEVIVNYYNKSDDYKVGKVLSDKVNGKNLVVVGFYTSVDDINTMITNVNTLNMYTLEHKKNMTIYTTSKDSVIDALNELHFEVTDSYQKSRDTYLKSRSKSIKNTIILSSIILIISFIEIFLMIRSSFLSRIKEVGIFRAIGVKKLDIYKMFFGEIFAITTIASMPGLIGMTYVLGTLAKTSFFADSFAVNLPVVLVAVIVIYLFNLIVGLLPVYNVIRKTPASILARTDLE